MKRVLIVGSAGQDGTLLGRRLQSSGIEYLGLNRRGLHDPDRRVLSAGSLTDPAFMLGVVRDFAPSHIFYFAAHHHSSQDTGIADEANLWRDSLAVQVTGLVNVLETVRRCAIPARIFYASSSHIFGAATESPQSEATPPAPDNVYAITKVAGMHACQFYRRNHGVFAVSGIFYNHESALRKEKFLSQKIIRAALAIKKTQGGELLLGDLSSRVDWGYAPDYVDAAIRMSELPQPGDYVIATGEADSVLDFVRFAFEEQGLDYREWVREKPGLVRPAPARLVGDASKLRRDTGWRPSVTFREMVSRLTAETRERLDGAA
jgi:GDPmannose 4,6-dehydratase